MRYEVGKEVGKEGGKEARTSMKEEAKREEESKEIAKREGVRNGGKKTEGDWRQRAAEKEKIVRESVKPCSKVGGQTNMKKPAKTGGETEGGRGGGGTRHLLCREEELGGSRSTLVQEEALPSRAASLQHTSLEGLEVGRTEGEKEGGRKGDRKRKRPNSELTKACVAATVVVHTALCRVCSLVVSYVFPSKAEEARSAVEEEQDARTARP